ncbi:MAG: SRPBCC domain-containing protein [Ilumatobacter sp.]|uniref:SRPBCC family protein n=1 Tax=Ilumatobacter sp. TaxID=1967498 RepID=UPI002608F056|nr:SRPBCC domain-containing protein [Ilumatobacter sp.]MDJ0767615.1 SRPBCC domain-containing protein [Ilumatobacter sp.]
MITLEHTISIDASPAAVFEMWTTADGLSAWWGRAIEVDPRPGGAIHIEVDAGHVMRGAFVELVEPRLVVFTFGWEGHELAPGSSTVEVRIEPGDGTTTLTLRHTGLPIALIESHARGWTHFLGDRLAGTVAAWG